MKSRHLTQLSKARTEGKGPLATTAVLALAALLAMPGTASANHQSLTAPANWTEGPFYGQYGTFFADIDGDGKADAIAVNADRVWWRPSNGCSFEAPRLLTRTPFSGRRGGRFAGDTGDNRLGPIPGEPTFPGDGGSYPSVYRSNHFADVTGPTIVGRDKISKADAIFNTSRGVIVRSSDDGRGRRWRDVELNRIVTFADMDADGKADAVELEPERIMVLFSNGNSFKAPVNTTPPGHPVQYGIHGTYLADVDGDERADAIFVNEEEISVRFLSPHDNIFYETSSWATGKAVNGELMNAFVDMTGDGTADAVVVDYNGLKVGESSRLMRKFGPMRFWTTERVTGTRETSFADVDGDRTADVIAVNDDGVWIRRSNFKGANARCPTDTVSP